MRWSRTAPTDHDTRSPKLWRSSRPARARSGIPASSPPSPRRPCPSALPVPSRATKPRSRSDKPRRAGPEKKIGRPAGRPITFRSLSRLRVVDAGGRGNQVALDRSGAVSSFDDVLERLGRGWRLVQEVRRDQFADVDAVTVRGSRWHGDVGDAVWVLRVVGVVDVRGALDGGAVRFHRAAGGIGADARDVEENDRRQDAQDRDDHEQLDEGEAPLAALRAAARIFE